MNGLNADGHLAQIVVNIDSGQLYALYWVFAVVNSFRPAIQKVKKTKKSQGNLAN